MANFSNLQLVIYKFSRRPPNIRTFINCNKFVYDLWGWNINIDHHFDLKSVNFCNNSTDICEFGINDRSNIQTYHVFVIWKIPFTCLQIGRCRQIHHYHQTVCFFHFLYTISCTNSIFSKKTKIMLFIFALNWIEILMLVAGAMIVLIQILLTCTSLFLLYRKRKRKTNIHLHIKHFRSMLEILIWPK